MAKTLTTPPLPEEIWKRTRPRKHVVILTVYKLELGIICLWKMGLQREEKEFLGNQTTRKSSRNKERDPETDPPF